MKNIKNTIAAMGLMAVLGLGATTAKAGLMLSDRGVNTNNQPACTKTDTGVFDQLTGILIVGFADATGILLGDRQAPCTENPSSDVAQPGILIVG